MRSRCGSFDRRSHNIVNSSVRNRRTVDKTTIFAVAGTLGSCYARRDEVDDRDQDNAEGLMIDLGRHGKAPAESVSSIKTGRRLTSRDRIEYKVLTSLKVAAELRSTTVELPENSREKCDILRIVRRSRCHGSLHRPTPTDDRPSHSNP